MISPRASPQLLRRGTTPVVPPPPLPPRRASPTLGSPTRSPRYEGLFILKQCFVLKLWPLSEAFQPQFLKIYYVNPLLHNVVLVQKGSMMNSVYSVANKTAILTMNVDKIKISVQSDSVISSISFLLITPPVLLVY